MENELFDNNITPIDAYKETAVIKKQSVSYTNTALDNKENISEQIINNIIRTVPSDREILFNIIPNNLLSLKSDNDRLKRIRVYEPIIWNGWQQILTSNELTPEIKLRRLKNTLGQFGGYLKFYESSGGKLRLAVDIYMQDEQVNQAKLIGQTFPNNLAKIADEPLISKYPLSDDKEMKLDEDSVVDITPQFINKFIAGKGALSEAENFTVLTDGTSTKIVIGYAEVNTNRVTIPVTTSRVSDIDKVSFSASMFREILIANKECESATLEISSQGLSKINFKVDDYTSTYWLVGTSEIN